MTDGRRSERQSNRRLTRRDFLMLAGAGLMGAGASGTAALGKPYLSRALGGDPDASIGSRISAGLTSRINRLRGSGMNVILVVIDSLRRDHIGAYGSDRVKTPNIDALAKESLRFTRARPEALPTIPARRTIHTGLRTWPFRNWDPRKGDNILLYGWQPIPDDQWTLAEILNSAGYTTLMVTDAYHECKPAMNFHRGFTAFDFVRGQEKDYYRPASLCPPERLENTLMTGDRADVEGKMRQYFANTYDRRGEEDYFAPQVFTRAMRYLEGLKKGRGRPFFLVVDSFDPHEPWDPPEKYVDLYDDGYDGPEPHLGVYGSGDYLTERQLGRMKALYAAEISMVDHWLGNFLGRADELGLLENTMVLLVSDHGYAFGEHGTIGKPPYALWPEVTDVPLIIRHPEGRGAGETSDYRASTHDIAPTVLGALGIDSPTPVDGQDLTVLLGGREPEPRPYFVGGLHDYVWAQDDDYALICRNDGGKARLYDLRSDPEQREDIAVLTGDVVRRMFEEYVLKDAGGPLPTYDA